MMFSRYTYNPIIHHSISQILIAYGQHQDEIMEVLYTDVDYKVFTEAARHVYDGGSPYERHTYRVDLLAVRLPVAVQSSR